MARVFYVFFKINLVVAEGGARFRLGHLQFVGQLRLFPHYPYAFPAAAGGRLYHDRITYFFGIGSAVFRNAAACSGGYRNAGFNGHFPGFRFVAQKAYGFW
jgi:hypothetical protein